jgi:hypothetical protein
VRKRVTVSLGPEDLIELERIADVLDRRDSDVRRLMILLGMRWYRIRKGLPCMQNGCTRKDCHGSTPVRRAPIKQDHMKLVPPKHGLGSSS